MKRHNRNRTLCPIPALRTKWKNPERFILWADKLVSRHGSCGARLKKARRLLGLAAGMRVTPSLRSRRRTLRRDWRPLREALLLTHGGKGEDMKMVDSLLSTFNQVLAQGAAGVSEICHKWRKRALEPNSRKTANGYQYRGKSALALFQASTLKRAMMWKIPNEKIKEKEEDAIKRWKTCGFLPDEKSLSSLRRFIQEKVGPVIQHMRHDPAYPLPSDRACYELNRKQGGVAKQIRMEMDLEDAKEMKGSNPFAISRLDKKFKFTDDELEQMALCIKQDKNYVFRETLRFVFDPDFAARQLEAQLEDLLSSSRTWAGRSVSFSPLEFVGRLTNDTLSLATAGTHVLRHRTAETIGRWAIGNAKSGPPPQKVRPLGLQEAGGKARIASLHPAKAVHAARLITRRWVPVLKKLRVTRDILTDRQIELIGKGERLFSADLSAATDWIPHIVAQQCWDVMCDLSGDNQWVRAAGRALLGPQTLKDGSRTCRGIHMGLGLSWTVLSLCNAWAAEAAGATKEDHQICGDDLIGLWDRKTSDRYTFNLQSIGLKVNVSKSFTGPRGVFCERFMSVRRPGFAKGDMHLTLAEASGAKNGWGLAQDDLSVLGHLSRIIAADRRRDLLLKIARETVLQLQVHKCPTGPTAIGGSGVGTPSIELLAGTLLQGGKAPQAPRKGALDARRLGLINEMSPIKPPSSMELEEAFRNLDYHETANRRIHGGEASEVRTLDYKTQRTAGRRRVAKGGRELKRNTLRGIVKGSEISKKSKRTILMILNRDPNASSAKSRRRIGRVICPKQTYVSSKSDELKLIRHTIPQRNVAMTDGRKTAFNKKNADVKPPTSMRRGRRREP